MVAPLNDAAAWQALTAHHGQIGEKHLTEFFAEDAGRAGALQAEGAGLWLDYSKQRVTAETIGLLVDLANERELPRWIEGMFTGERINNTENRSVLHTALRLPADAELEVEGQNVVADVHAVLEAMSAFADKVRAGEWTGYTGKRIKNVINIGIGGSDLGPVMASLALANDSQRDLSFHFVSNVDGTDWAEKVIGLDPMESLIVISSKTFTTQETMTNAHTARTWLLEAAGDDAAVAKHFVAVSTNAAKVSEFGIDTANMFGFWEWVGGRYSMDSAIGLSTMIQVGPANFRRLLSGLHAMDTHFRTTEFDKNLPVLHGLLCVWNRNFLGCESVAVLPYDQYLLRFPAYLQQMIMESNGKSVTRDGEPVDYHTSATFWGEPGTNGQHSFYQLIHQGTSVIPADFILMSKPIHDLPPHHDLLAANALAQAAVMAFGRSAEEVAADGTREDLVTHKVMPGNRPNNFIMGEQMSPEVLGALIAFYEHSTFVQSVIWGINAFDQWGVELGKVMASKIAPMLTGEAEPSMDGSTNQIVARYRADR